VLDGDGSLLMISFPRDHWMGAAKNLVLIVWDNALCGTTAARTGHGAARISRPRLSDRNSRGGHREESR
jgi:hypothetical protein